MISGYIRGRSRIRFLTLSGIGILLVSSLSQAATKSVAAVRTDQPPQIDGRLSDGCWKTAGTRSLIVVSPASAAGAAPENATQVSILYDESHLYLGFRCEEEDPKGLIIQNSPERDGNWGDDTVEVFLDPNQTKTGYYQIIITAGGIISDLYYEKAAKGDRSWDSDCDAKVFIGEDYWSAEVRIPFVELGLNPGTTSDWGFNCTRWLPKGKINQSLFPLPGGLSHQPDRFGILSGLALDYTQYWCQLKNLSPGSRCFGDNLFSFILRNDSSRTRKATAAIEYVPLAGGTPSRSSLPVSLKPGEEREISLDYLIKDRGVKGKLLLKIINPTTGKVSLMRTGYFTSPSRLLEIKMPQSDYYLSDEKAELLVRINLGQNNLKECSLSVTVIRDGRSLALKEIPSLSREISVPFSIAGLEAGGYRLSARLKDKREKVLVAEEVSFNRVKGPFDD